MTLCLELNFRLGGNGLPFLREGWADPDLDFTWTEGNRAALAFSPPRPGRYILCLDAISLGPQRLTISINGAFKKRYRFDGTCSAVFPVDIDEAASALPVYVELNTPDANTPLAVFGNTGDTRILAFAVSRLRLLQRQGALLILPPVPEEEIESAAGISRTELVSKFESLGHNCEFGLIQRGCGAEPIGLLRFGGISVADLIKGLRNDFEGLGQTKNMKHFFWEQGPDPEYILHDSAYSLTYHTGVTAGQVEPEELYKREALRLSFYRRKILEDIETGSKIFVFQWPGSMMTQDVMPIVEAMTRRRSNTLLWVTASSEYPPGSVEFLTPRLLRGYVDSFAPLGSVQEYVQLIPWLSLCVNALRISKQSF